MRLPTFASRLGSQPPEASPDEGPRVYYPELDGLRVIAFLLVYNFHGAVP